MEVDPVFFDTCKQKAKDAYTAQPSLYCPYFKSEVVLNSEGFHHLQFSARRERNKSEQLVKFRLLPQALEVIHKSGTPTVEDVPRKVERIERYIEKLLKHWPFALRTVDAQKHLADREKQITEQFLTKLVVDEPVTARRLVRIRK